MTAAPSRGKIRLAQLVVAIALGFVVAGVLWHGVSAEALQRVWQNLLERPGGPMTFRFILQPVMATIAALKDGVADARARRSPFTWAVLTDRENRGPLLGEAWIATARIILLGLVMDSVYQYIVFDTFHPVEAVFVALLLAFVPYVLLRGPISRAATWWRSRDGRVG